jgi:RNA polymerase sigma-70 factor (ECF subfamily)
VDPQAKEAVTPNRQATISPAFGKRLCQPGPAMTDAADRLYERVLVLRCQARDEAAFEEIVARYTPRLRYYLRRMLDVPAADDALQEVWLDAFRGLPGLIEPGAFPAWIYRLARDRAFRELRRRRAYLPLEETDVIDEARGADDFSTEDAARIHHALDALLPEHREVLVLRFIESMTYEQIAGIVGCQLGTVRSRLHYAKRAMRRVIEGTE